MAGKRIKARPEKALPTRKVTMKMYDVDVDVLIRTLARAANQNIMINEKVKGKADVSIKNAPWDPKLSKRFQRYGEQNEEAVRVLIALCNN